MHDGSSLPPSPRFDVGAALDAIASADAVDRIAKQQKLIGEWLDADRVAAHAFWDYVRTQSLKVGTWVFIADPADVVEVLADDGKKFSVREYDRRMRAASGRFYLGMDGPEHKHDAMVGAVIPSWNYPECPETSADAGAVLAVSERATRAVLASLGRRAQIARLTAQADPGEFLLSEIVGPVLDASSAHFFGVPGPSSLSLIQWAKDITWYNFRAYADDAEDRSCAVQSSALFRGHVLSLIAAAFEQELQPPAETASNYMKQAFEAASHQRSMLKLSVEIIRKKLSLGASDDDVARNLMGIIIGSLTATAKGLGEALLHLAERSPDNRIVWPDVASRDSTAQRVSAGCPRAAESSQPRAELPVADLPPSGAAEAIAHPLYSKIVAATLAELERGSLDSVYRTYLGDARKLGGVEIERGDRVIVWLGGALQTDHDNLFGIGIHRCPGKDMGKAIIEGMLRSLTTLRGESAPRIYRRDEQLYVAFENVGALSTLVA